MNGWNSIKDGMPDVIGGVLLISAIDHHRNRAVFLGYRWSDKWMTTDTMFMAGHEAKDEISPQWEVTHWMPLPEPPIT